MNFLRSTPVEDYRAAYGLWVKREDLCCDDPNFAKVRGVAARMRYARDRDRVELFGVLDSSHSRNGWAVARVAKELGVRCVVYYPELKAAPGPRRAQLEAQRLGAELRPLKAGRAFVLQAQARKDLYALGAGGRREMLPNGLALAEMVEATAHQVADVHQGRHHQGVRQRGTKADISADTKADISADTKADISADTTADTKEYTKEYHQRGHQGDVFDRVIIPVGSGTLAAGVIRGFLDLGASPHFVLVLGYSRSKAALLSRLRLHIGPRLDRTRVEVVDLGHQYADVAPDGPTPPWPCSPYYELKAFRWWMEQPRLKDSGDPLLWNAG